jgi:hypothetical protein
MKRNIILTQLIFFSFIFLNTSHSTGALLGDVDHDDKIGLTEATNALQISAGIRSAIETSYGVVWKGAWKSDQLYKAYDAVNYEGSSYICLQEHRSISSNELSNTNIWNVLSVKGDTGDQGPQGVKGDQGDQGIQGIQGPKGDTGAAGPQGLKGDKGDTGTTGPQGPKGDTGATGATGPQGSKGDTGDQGPQGVTGQDGSDGLNCWDLNSNGLCDLATEDINSDGYCDAHDCKGEKGDTGDQGPQGVKGDQGDQGIQGPKGDTGAAGPQGLKGDKGDTGTTGPQGPKGDTGATGATGPQGSKGDTGDQGPQGPQGIQGPQGPEGPTGPQGLQGEQGLKGDTGDTGPQGIQGPKGDIGDTGPVPNHQWNDTSLRFINSDGTWGSYTDLKGEPGEIQEGSWIEGTRLNYMLGLKNNTSTQGNALYAINYGENELGSTVYAKNYHDDSGIAVYGSAYGIGVKGNGGSAGIGVYGLMTGVGIGVKGESTNVGVGVEGNSKSSWGMKALNTTSGHYAYLGGMNKAASFDGDVSINGTLSKSAGAFKIDHPLDPENKYLFHSFVESSEMKNIYDGVVNLDKNGEAWVDLPDWFEALNRNFRYQLTCIGGYVPIYIAEEISQGRFKISGGTKELKVSWQITGIRKDAYAIAHPIIIEKEKPDDEKGQYLHPDLFLKE